MKVVCDSCHAKYQVADERVAGKKLKIRCRRCAGTIIVRGDQSLPSDSAQSLPPVSSPELAAAAVAVTDSAPDLVGFASSPATPTAPVQDSEVEAPEVDMPAVPHSAEWYVSVSDAEHGPMSLEALIVWLGDNPHGWEAHVWRDGFPDWVELRYVDMIVEAAAAMGLEEPSGSQEVDDEAEPTQSAFSSKETFGDNGHVSDEEQATSVAVAPVPQLRTDEVGNGPMLEAGAEVEVTPSVQPQIAQVPAAQAPVTPAPVAQAPAMQGLAAAAPAPQQQVQAPASSPRVSGAAAFSGGRNEESVLFNVADLKKVARGSAASAPPVSTTNYSSPGLASPSLPVAAPSSPGFASGDGSGLIDIRALAAMSQTLQSQAQAAEVEPSSSLPQSGAAATLPPIDTLAPVADMAARQPNRALPLAIVSAAVIVAAAVVTVALVLRAPVPTAGATPTAAASAVAAPSMPPVAPADMAAPRDEQATAVAEVSEKSENEVATEAADATDATLPVKAAEAEVPAEQPAAAPKRRPKVARARRKKRASAVRKPARTVADTEAKSEAPALAEDRAKKKVRQEVSLDDVFSDAPAKPAKSVDAAPSSGQSIDDMLAGTAPAPKKTPAPAQNRSLDDLLSGAADAKSPKKAPAVKPSAPAANLAAQPSRANVISAMRGVTPGVQRCASKNSVSGIAKVKIMVAGSSGKVTAATITGVTGPVVACIGQAVRKANFPKFSKPSFSVTFPFRL